MHPHRKLWWKHTIIAGIIGFLGLGCLLVGLLLFDVALTPAPDIASFANRQVDQSTKIYDRTGQVLLYDYNRDSKRIVVPLSQISPNAINATVAIEDSSFYEHGGIRIASILRAMIVDALGGSLSQGGSTITQQVVKNTLLTNKKSFVRKIHEWILSIKMEQKYSKNQILSTYLNNIPYGGTLYGIEAASESYFGIPAKDLSLPQAAYLAAMVQAPTYYSPYGQNRAALDARKNLVLQRMLTVGFITQSQYTKAKNTKVTFGSYSQHSIIAPSFVFYVLNQLKQQYGANALVSGLRVTTTLDVPLDQKIESILKDHAASNLKDFNASNAASVAIDPASGQILAMVGSNNFFSTSTTMGGQFNAATAARQPGSTMKPFVYALGLEKGYTPDTVVFDAPTQFSTACSPSAITNDTPPCYAPIDYNKTFQGPMTFETALAQSINIPAIKVLYLVGVRNAVNLAESMGLNTLGSASQYGLTFVLGAGDVRLLDMVDAYAAFANQGVYNPSTAILEVDDAQGNVLQKYTPQPKRVLPAHIALDISAMLSNAPARVPEYRLNSPLSFPGYDVAVKTGTTDKTKDAWVIGYSPSIALGVWAGNNNATPMVKSIAGFIAAPMWHEAMAYALAHFPKKYFAQPDPVPASVPPMLRGDWQIPDKNGNIVPHSLLYWTNPNDPRNPTPPANPQANPQFARWEYGISYWYAQHPELFTKGVMLPMPLSTATTTLPEQSSSSTPQTASTSSSTAQN